MTGTTLRTRSTRTHQERIEQIRRLVCTRDVPVAGQNIHEDFVLANIAGVLGGGESTISRRDYLACVGYLASRPTFRANRSSLTTVVNQILRIRGDHDEAFALDAGYDGGEFSGPAHQRAEASEIEWAIASNGWTREELAIELRDRTSARWAHRVLMGWF
jgi:hypothetical protein